MTIDPYTGHEASMIAAHKQGLRDAAEQFAVIAKTAMDRFPGDQEQQFSYIAGFIQELRRLGHRASA